MQKADIVRQVVVATGIEFKDVEAIVEATLITIKKNVKAGHRIDFRGFGAFYPKVTAEKKGRRPVNGPGLEQSEEVKIPRTVKPVFKASRKYFAIDPEFSKQATLWPTT